MKKIIVSAPGKLMLFGEHAVVYGRPCIVTAVNQRLKVSAQFLKKKEFYLDAPDVYIKGYTKSIKLLGQGHIPKEAAFVEGALYTMYNNFHIPFGVSITTSSDFSSQFGFGSSSASTVCTIKALSDLLQLNLPKREIFDLAYKTVLDIQKKGSGFDVAAAVFGGTLYYLSGGKTIDPLLIDAIPLVVGYSGIKAETVTLMELVKEKMNAEPDIVEDIFNNIETIVFEAKRAMLASKWEELGELMNRNQAYLYSLGVSIKKIDDMITAAKTAGAYGGKLSGAGGGDCIVALTPSEKKDMVEKAIEAKGGTIMKVTINAEGVKREEE